MKIISHKNAISSVVAISLLLVVTVFSAVSFQGWFMQYMTGMNTKVESSSDLSDMSSRIETVSSNKIYFYNGGLKNISIEKVKVGDVDCGVVENATPGIKEIDVSDCISSLTGSIDVVIYTDDKIFSKGIIIEKPYVAPVSSWIDGVDLLAGKSVYFEDAPTTLQWKTSGTACDTPQCILDGAQFDNLSSSNSVDYSEYPARDFCKSIGGRLPSVNELINMGENRFEYDLNMTGFNFYWTQSEDSDITRAYCAFNASGTYMSSTCTKIANYYVRCIKD